MVSSKWRIAHASAAGAAHLAQNTECQDRYLCRTIDTREGEILIAAVADGAGSTSSGQIGAETACRLFADEAEDFLKTRDASLRSLNADFGRYWLTFFQKTIAEIAADEEKPVRDYASTFVAAIVGETSAAFFQVGDGAAVYAAAEDAENYVFGIDPIETEYANITHFLTDAAADANLRFNFVEKAIENLILFSDGVFPVAVDYKTNQPHAPFLRPMIAPLKNGRTTPEDLNAKLENFLASPKINEKTDDDKTIILAARIRDAADF